MILYHGSAQFDSIMKHGLIPDFEMESDFGEGNYLVSCGGTYLSNDLETAAFYAETASHSEMSLGMDPCIFAVEIDPQHLIADEDSVWTVVGRLLEEQFGLRYQAERSQDEIEELLAERSPGLAFYEDIARNFELDQSDVSVLETMQKAVRAFSIRRGSYEWDPREANLDEVGHINDFCRLAKVTLSPSWCMNRLSSIVVTGRTLEVIDPLDSDKPNRIVGYMRLLVGPEGLTIEGAEKGGVFDDYELQAFHDAYLERQLDRGVQIESEWSAESASQLEMFA
jgi:hypothetical protein